MIGLGILELGLIVGAGYYILSFFSKKKRIQYIEINQQQFDEIQDALIINNIIPTDINSNNFYDRLQQIPPSYQETTEHLPPVPPYQSNGASQLHITSTEPAVLEVSNIDNSANMMSSQSDLVITNSI